MQLQSSGDSMGFLRANSGNVEDVDILSMPSFEMSNTTDRPAAPFAEDFPLGCEVELRDVEFAKTAQESRRWEPTMDLLFAVPRRRVKVRRHSGDYTFVLCTSIEGFELVGCTLYRACLSEPKIKTTKYFAAVAANGDESMRRPWQSAARSCAADTYLEQSEPSITHLGSQVLQSIHSTTPLDSGSSSSDVFLEAAKRQFSMPYPSTHSLEEHSWPLVHPCTSYSVPHASSHDVGLGDPLTVAEANSTRGDEGDDGVDLFSNESSLPLVEVTPPANPEDTRDSLVRRHNQFTAAMKHGTQEIERHHYTEALQYYNLALATAPEEECRVLSSRSVAYLQLRQTERALLDAKRVIQLVSHSPLGYVRVGNILRSMKCFSEAHKYYTQASQLDASNKTIYKLLMENSIAMLFEARTRRFSKVKMQYDVQSHNAVAVARHSVNGGNVVIREATNLFSPIYYNYMTADDGNSASACSHCGRLLVDEAAILSGVSDLTRELVHAVYSEPAPLNCLGGCANRYCCEECRSKGWAEHHWVECPKRGRWKKGFVKLHSFLDNYVRSAMGTANEGAAERLTAPAEPQCAGEDVSAVVVAACVRIAARMMSRMLSCAWQLPDAVHMYDWLRVSPAVQSQRGMVSSLLSESYATLSGFFLGEEQQFLSYELFVSCYEQAKSNAIPVVLSTLERIASRAENRLTLLSGQQQQPYTAPRYLRSGTPSDASRSFMWASSEGDTQLASENESLLALINATSQDIKGTRGVFLCLFEIYAAMLPVSGGGGGDTRSGTALSPSLQQVAPPAVTARTPNVVLELSEEGCSTATLRASTLIRKDALLIANWPSYLNVSDIPKY